MFALIVLAAGCLIIRKTGSRTPLPYYEEMVQAATRMAACEEAVRAERFSRGLPMGEEDLLDTGLIGVSSSPITTTAGAPEAKRTAATSDMAALCVRLLREAGVDSGDRIGACFSGSFPGLNLAVACAADAIGAKLIYTASVGASSYGANLPEFTSPEMLKLVYDKGLISQAPAAVTTGGDGDLGGNMIGVLLMEDDGLEKMWERLEKNGLSPVRIGDYRENLAWRMRLYGEIDCFVNVGGNVAGMGRDERAYDRAQGLVQDSGEPLSEKSGLIERYLRQGVPVIHLLNLKRLCTEYGIEYDPPLTPEIGKEPVYYRMAYSRTAILFTGILAAAPIFLAAFEKRRIKAGTRKDRG